MLLQKIFKELGKFFLFTTVLIFPGFIYGAQLVDLTHSFSANTLHWPTAHPFKLQKGYAGYTPQGYFYAVNDYSSSEHVGTHMDAPIHFAKGHPSVAEIPLTQLVGPAVVIDVRPKSLKVADFQISIEDFKSWEKQNGPIPQQAIVLLETGYARFWPNSKRYLGTNVLGTEGVAKLHFPGLAPEAAQWLIDKRKVHAIGIDTASIDFGQSKLFLTHRVLGNNNIPFFENVANLSELPAKGFMIYALPMKIAGGTGAPLRIIAVL